MSERLHHEKKRGIYKSRGLHKAFNKSGIPYAQRIKTEENLCLVDFAS